MSDSEMAMDQYLHPSYCRGLTMMNIHKISRHIMTYHISWNNSSISHMLHGASIFTYKTGSKLGHKNEVNGGIHIPIIPAPWWAHVFFYLSQLKSRCLFHESHQIPASQVDGVRRRKNIWNVPSSGTLELLFPGGESSHVTIPKKLHHFDSGWGPPVMFVGL